MTHDAGASDSASVTAVTNASRTFLMDIRTQEWSDVCLKEFGLTEAMLPVIKSNSEVYGLVKAGPLVGVPIAGCLGDQQAATLGAPPTLRCCRQSGKIVQLRGNAIVYVIMVPVTFVYVCVFFVLVGLSGLLPEQILNL